MRAVTLATALITLLSAQAFSTQTFAASVSKPAPGDWVLTGCTASTVAQGYRLEVAVDDAKVDAKVRPLEIRVATMPGTPLPGGATLALDKKTTYAFAPVDQVLWNIPRGTLNLITALRRLAKVQIQISAGTLPVAKITFSLKGSTAVLTALQKTCNGAKDFESDGFERAFLPAVVANIDPTQIKDATSLRELVAQALGAFRTSGGLQIQLNALSQQFLTQISEYEQLKSNIGKLNNETVVRLTKQRTTSQGKIDQSNADIPQLQTQVAQQEAALTPANASLAAAQADIAPMYASLKRYQDAVDDADSSVSTAQATLNQSQTYESQMRSRLQDAANGSAQAANDINTIQNQIASLRQSVSTANSYVDQARNVYNQASSQRSNFNKSSEVQRRLSSDSRLSSIDYSIRDAQNRLQDGQRHISDAEGDRARFGGDLHTCQAVVPAKDCSHEKDLSDRADQRMQQAQNELNGLRNQISNLQSQRDNFRSTIESEVERDYQVLSQNESDAQNKYQDAQNQASQIASQLSRAQNTDLPQAQSALTSWQNAQAQAAIDVRNAAANTSQASRNVSDAQSDEDAAESRRNSWMQSSGYNSKNAILSRAQNMVNSINSALNQLDRTIAVRQKTIRDETKSLADTEAQMQIALATIKQKEDRSAEVQKILAPYFTQRDALTTQKAAADQAFTAAQTAFAQGLTPAVRAPAL